MLQKIISLSTALFLFFFHIKLVVEFSTDLSLLITIIHNLSIALQSCYLLSGRCLFVLFYRCFMTMHKTSCLPEGISTKKTVSQSCWKQCARYFDIASQDMTQVVLRPYHQSESEYSEHQLRKDHEINIPRSNETKITKK